MLQLQWVNINFCVLVKDIVNPDQAFRFKCWWEERHSLMSDHHQWMGSCRAPQILDISPFLISVFLWDFPSVTPWGRIFEVPWKVPQPEKKISAQSVWQWQIWEEIKAFKGMTADNAWPGCWRHREKVQIQINFQLISLFTSAYFSGHFCNIR